MAGLGAHVIVEAPALGDLFLGQAQEVFGDLGLALTQHREAGFVVDVLVERERGRLGIQLQRVLALLDEVGIVADQRPVAALDGGLLLFQAVDEVVTVRDAVAVADQKGRPIVGLGFEEGLDGLHIVGAEGDAGHVDAAVAHGHQGQVLLGTGLAAEGELGDRAERSGLGHLAAGVGVNLGVEHQDVDVLTGSEHVIEAAVADIVGPTIAADGPDALLDEHVGHGQQVAGFGVRDALQLGLEGRHAGALLFDALLAGLIGVKEGGGEIVADGGSQALSQFLSEGVLVVDGQAHAESELGVILEQGVGPGGTAALGVHRVRRGGQIASVDGRAAGGVAANGPVAEQLGHQFDVGRFAAAGAGAGELEQRAE